MSLGLVALSLLWVSLIAYAALGGADFGAGVWDLLAFGSNRERHLRLINQAIGPVWEANHVWLIFLIVGLFTAFPVVYAALSIALFVPLTLALIGIVLRGAAFIFRTHAFESRNPLVLIWNRIFSVASTITPFLLGASAAAVASGKIRVNAGVLVPATVTSWLSPFAITIGAMAVSLCAVLAAIYLTVEATNTGQFELAEAYRLRAIVAGAITAFLGALGLLLATNEAPILWQGMLAHTLPVVIATMLIGLFTAYALFYKHYRLARILIVGETAFLLSSWGLSQLPYLIPPDLTIDNSANAPTVIATMLAGTAVGMLILIPSLWYLFYVFKIKQGVALKEGKE